MIFTEGKCPKCLRIIQLSSADEIMQCRYCGEEVNSKEIIKTVEKETVVKMMDKDEYTQELNEALEDFPQMLNYNEGIPMFKKDTYKDAFDTYFNQNYQKYMAIDRLYAASGDKEGFLRRMVNQLVETEKHLLERQEKGQRENRLINDNLKLTVYMIPAMLHYQGQAMRELTECVAEGWQEAFPKYQISCTNFAKINSNFKSKLCYITTAVCESLGKEDDCYELNILRDYRDTYLRSTEDGARIVNAYYDIAPSIVKRINKCKDRGDIYREIYTQYLSPCIRLLEKGRKEECKEIYTDMVLGLERKYLLQQ
ncbi:MAG: hypothetical protein K2M46_09665 [Lachnospiraceae bacterium]|nr:hypothetical protein [Lachnospiraceae bacterium]